MNQISANQVTKAVNRRYPNVKASLYFIERGLLGGYGHEFWLGSDNCSMATGVDVDFAATAIACIQSRI